MTWIDQHLEEQLKAPAIGTPEWFQCVPPVLAEVARQLFNAKTPVYLQRKVDTDSPTYLVLFDGTDFIAGGFDDQDAADRFSDIWNRSAQ